MSPRNFSCHLSGDKWAGTTEEELCDIFMRTFADETISIVAKVELEAFPTDTARAVAFDQAGNVVAGLDVSVMDRELGPDSWRTLARGLAQAIAKSPS